MITGHDILKLNNEEVLYLYLDYNYEFAKMDKIEVKKSLSWHIYDYMKNKKIKFDGTKIGLVLGTIFLGTIIINPFYNSGDIPTNNLSHNIAEKIIANSYKEDNEETVTEQEKSVGQVTVSDNTTEKKESNNIKNEKENSNINKNNVQQNTSNSNVTKETTKDNNSSNLVVDDRVFVTVYRASGAVLNIELEEYIVGVVAAEMPASFSMEALKAQAVAARTYTLKAISVGKKLTDTVNTQVYKDNNQLRSDWGSSYDTYHNKIKKAVDDTKGVAMTYNGIYIDAVFHSTSNGYTQSAKEVWGNDIVYLQVVESKWDLDASSYLRTEKKDFDVMSLLLGIVVDENSDYSIVSRDVSGRVSKVKINDKIISGVEARAIFNLRSADFDFVFSESGVSIITRGYGHGVGMSQYGANGMAKEGYSYTQILNHYYKGINISKI